MRALLRHFAGRVRYYESWVEPNHTSSWAGGVNAAQYAAVLETEYRVFRASAPRDRLMFAGVADFGIADGSPNGLPVLPYTDQVLAALHGRPAFDLVALHAYRFPPSLAPDDAGYTHYPVSPVWRKDTWTQQLEAYEQEFTAHGYGTAAHVAHRVRLAREPPAEHRLFPEPPGPGHRRGPGLPGARTARRCPSSRPRSGSTNATMSRGRPTPTRGSSPTTGCSSTTSRRSRRQRSSSTSQAAATEAFTNRRSAPSPGPACGWSVRASRPSGDREPSERDLAERLLSTRPPPRRDGTLRPGSAPLRCERNHGNHALGLALILREAGHDLRLTRVEALALLAGRLARSHLDRLVSNFDRGIGVSLEVVIPAGIVWRSGLRREDHVAPAVLEVDDGVGVLRARSCARRVEQEQRRSFEATTDASAVGRGTRR